MPQARKAPPSTTGARARRLRGARGPDSKHRNGRYDLTLRHMVDPHFFLRGRISMCAVTWLSTGHAADRAQGSVGKRHSAARAAGIQRGLRQMACGSRRLGPAHVPEGALTIRFR